MNYINAWKIFPPHTIERMEEYAEIKNSMKKNGWTGRPIVAIQYKDKLLALTGSHRISAARQTNTQVPIHIIAPESYNVKTLIKDYNTNNTSKYSIDYLTTVFPPKILKSMMRRPVKDRYAISLLKTEATECYI